MDGDMLARLQQLQAKVTQFGELATQLAQAVPKQAEGCDASGWVRVVLGGDGLPTAISVRDGWDRRIEAAGLGAAVMDANADAIRQGMKAFSDHLDDNRWWTKRAHAEEDGPDPSAGPVARPPAGTERDPGELTEDVLKALHTVQQPAETAPGAVEGSDPQRYVTVALGPGGLARCTIDPGWAARRDSNAITAALTQALRAARHAIPAPTAPSADLDGLLGDALATLRAITDRRPAGGNNS
jgi:DNA-binding protein YbaB